MVGEGGRQVGTAGEGPARAGVMLATFAYALWVIIVAFMGGAGWALAHSFATADAGMTATRAAFVFDMLRPLALGLATGLFGWAVLDGKVFPRWLGTAAVAAGGVGIVLALVFGEDTKADQAAFVLPVVWQLVTGVVMLREA